MKSKHPDLSRATRRTPLVLILAVVLLVVLAGTVWAAWGAARSLPVGLSAWLDVDATATPTRTPRPVTITPTPIPLESGDPRAHDLRLLPPTPAPQPEVTPAPMPDWLAGVVRQYGMDTDRRFVVIDLKTQNNVCLGSGGGSATARAAREHRRRIARLSHPAVVRAGGQIRGHLPVIRRLCGRGVVSVRRSWQDL